jgi:hypothetical protein
MHGFHSFNDRKIFSLERTAFSCRNVDLVFENKVPERRIFEPSREEVTGMEGKTPMSY